MTQQSGALRRLISSRSCTSWKETAQRRLTTLGATSPERWPTELLDFIPALSPKYLRPVHLAPLAEQLDRSLTEPVHFWFTVPPRHAKTETLAHHFARVLRHDPTTPLLYCAHTATFANKVSKRIKALARAAGVELAAGSNRADEWETTAGGGLVARGVGGEVIGRGARQIAIDDPVKGREVANSQIQRDGVWDWALTDVYSRLAPGGSVFLVHTRWNGDDPIGRAQRLLNWPGTTLRAIAEEGDTDGREPGQALWPEGGWTAEELAELERIVGPYRWAALYQGRPMPRGGTVFGEPCYYDELPAEGYRVVYGLDLAYTAKTQADWSVCLDGLAAGNVLYVTGVQRKQVDAPSFLLTLKAQHSARPGPMRWHCSGTEKGSAQFIRQRLPAVQAVPATTDKFERSQNVAAAWNDSPGRVLLPSSAYCENHEGDWRWVDTLISEVCGFTGVNDPQDDQVDALGSAHSLLSRPSGKQALDVMRRMSAPRRI